MGGSALKLNQFDENGGGPEQEILREIISNYRQFVGTKAAFHIEYISWPGQFQTKDEEMEFFLNDYSRPDDYEVVDKWHDEAVQELSVAEVELIDTRRSRNLWRISAIILLIPYLALWYLSKNNT